ncbi:FtsB family cell division protein [Roseomonas gilardii]|uniref:Septum formation initiator family protein n=1 Tax=Roseomonas gilardii TaxID=257708 RepID=A0ABU3MH06_9PROT|nr:septum formation initiator family protein [Roseomonas gilardii]MDT8331925.1 septum formation initiator family protein [Roseomonas gilardii]PZP47490.1 MAG: septum formation initiator protein [Azospirillum brasilense]SUE44081.1 Septum formation initiator [Roseomonas gilardii subsp. rosea]
MLKSIKRRLQGAVLPAVFLAICAYFAHHAISGSRGTEARAVRMAQIEDAKAELRLAEAERDAMDRRVAGLRAEHLDRDMLDERARALLNVVGKDEIVIPYGPNERLF